MSFKHVLYIGFVLFYSSAMLGQTNKQKQLEAKRNELQKEIKKVNRLLFSAQKQGKGVLEEIKDINQKIKVRSKLITAIKDESSYLQQAIDSNAVKIETLNTELEALKAEYGELIYKSYKSQSKKSQLQFLLSSKDFEQGFRRLKYLNQYAEYRKNQADTIKVMALRIKGLSDKLQAQKEQKDDLLASTEEEKNKIDSERKSQQKLLSQVKRRERQYISQIKKKQAEERKLNAEIEKVIREALAAAKKKSSTSKSGFELTPEAKKLAFSFETNKGKLPWPVVEGVVVRNYGVRPHPTLKGIKIESNGIHIATSSGANARAIFKGTVFAIQSVKGKYAVYVQHGNYISLYNNLDKVYVSKGQQVSLKQNIGTVFTDKVTGKTILKFQVWKDTKHQNPRTWLVKG